MSDENSSAQTATATTVIVKHDASNALGIASFVFGLISIFILSPIFVPLALILGIVAVLKKQILWGGLGLVCALAGFVTSPILLGILGIASIGAVQ